MNDRPRTRSSGVTVLTAWAVLLVATACGTTKSDAAMPADGAGARQGNANTGTTSGQTGSQYLMADESYGAASRARDGAAAPTREAPVCAPAGSPCLEP